MAPAKDRPATRTIATNREARHEYFVIEALETGREPEITGEEAKKAIALIEAIYRSSREGGWAEL